MKRAFCLAFVVSLCAACSDVKPPNEKAIVDPANIEKTLPELTVDPTEGRTFHLTMASVRRITVPELLPLNGQIEPDETLTTPVISLMPGRVEKAPVQLGEVVHKGQLLAQIRSDEVAQVEADLLKDILGIDADIMETEVDYKLAQKVFERKTELQGEGIAARADVDAAKRDVDHSAAKLQSLRTKRSASITSASERLRLFGVEENDIATLLRTRHIDNTFDIYSPRHGVISHREADIGQLIDNQKPLFVVTDLSRVWLMADVYEKDIERICVGDAAAVTIDSFPNKAFKGVVDYIATDLTPDTRTLKVRIKVENPESLLRPKMFARVALKTGEKSILAVPAESVQKTGETYVAYVRSGENKYRERKVEVGQTFGEVIEVRSGLTQGETVVAHGSLELQGEMLQKISND